MTATAPKVGSRSSPWVRRLRLVLAVVLLWAGLRFIVGTTLLPPGLDRPVSLAASPWVIPAGLAVAVLLWLGAYGGTLLAGRQYRERGLVIVGLALALWAVGGGTMDDWLKLCAADEVVGPPSGGAYWPLVVEYVFLAVVMAGAAAAGGLAVPVTGQPERAAPGWLRRVFGLDADPRYRAQGPVALLTTTVVICVLMLSLTGSAVGHTLRGQVYFAVTVASAAGVFVATRVVSVRSPIWYWPAPILAGLLGMLIAAFKPDLMLPAGYDELNSIPAWGLARPLPVEMVGVGVVVALWTVRGIAAGARSEQG